MERGQEPDAVSTGRRPTVLMTQEACGPQKLSGRGSKEDSCPYWESKPGRPVSSHFTELAVPIIIIIIIVSSSSITIKVLL